MGSVWAQVALVLGFVLVGGAFAAAEMALVSLRPGQLARISQQGRSGQQIARLLADPNRFLSAVQIGVTLAGFFSSAVGAVTLSAPVAVQLRRAGVSERASSTLAVVLVTVAVAYVSLVLGELAPKRLALQRTERIARIAAAPVEALARGSRPLIWLLGGSANIVVRLAGGDPSANREVMTEEELRDLVATSADLTQDERRLIGDVLDAGDRPIREVMVPRLDVTALQGDLTVASAITATEHLPFSRYPVVDGGLDDVVGFVHLRDLLRAADPDATGVRALARPVMRLPDSRRALPALVEMRAERVHLAVVVDEYGGSAGIVTLEDLIEELVGDITDEFDAHVGAGRPGSTPPQGPGIPREPVSAQLRLDEFAEATGVVLPTGPYDTAAGWLVAQLGRIPVVGDRADVGDLRLTVAAMGGRRVDRVLVTASPVDPVPADGDDQRPAGTG